MRRKVLYISVTVLIVGGFLFWIGRSVISKPPTCFDQTQNQQEEGVDCGGPCSLMCKESVRSPVVLWTRALEIATSTYTAAAYVENPNSAKGAGALHVPYAFRLLDQNNVLIIERDGYIDIPPQQKVSIVEPNIDVGSRTVARAFLEFSDEISWNRIPASSIPTLRVENLSLAQDGSSVSAVLRNLSRDDARSITVTAVLFDAEGVARAASKSTITRVPAQGSQSIVFTWPSPNPTVVSAELIPLPALPR